MILASPSMIDWAACITDFIPLAQTLLMVVQGTLLGIPAPKAACLAGAWPLPACTTFPMSTSSTNSGFRFIRSKAPFMAIDPNFVAGISDKLPKKLPIGVLAALTITTSLFIIM